MTKRSKYLFVFLFLFFGIQTGIQAQLWIPPGRQYMHPTEPFTYDLGINKYQKDYYLYVAPTVNLNFGGDFWSFVDFTFKFFDLRYGTKTRKF